ncbi:MAG: ABC transporter permease [Bacteroidales bacterium]|nr:ABC transporter permease [Bacteroidales bacterium]
MNFPFYIARRYLISKKSHNIIHIISIISIVGVAIGTMALIIVLSVFNGFENLVLSLFSSFNPDIQITASHGKTFDVLNTPVDQLKKIPGVRYITQVIEEDALIKYKEKQAIVRIKGVSESYLKMSGVDSMMVEGTFLLQEEDKNYALLGYGVAATLGANLKDYLNPLVVYVPRREASLSGGLENAFNSEVIFPSGYFAIQQDYDVKYVILPLRFVQQLLSYGNQRTALEIGLSPGSDHENIQRQIESLLGKQFVIKNRFQQQEILYKIMKSEKLYIFLILSFILFMATFNVIGSLSMLILDKKKDIAILRSMGAPSSLIQRIFLFEGTMISLIGAILGLVLGAIICWVQIRYGLIHLGTPDSSFVVSAYPVQMRISDFFLVFTTVFVIGFVAAWYPVHNIRKIHVGQIKLE